VGARGVVVFGGRLSWVQNKLFSAVECRILAIFLQLNANIYK